MGRKGPLITLLAGAALGAVLLWLSTNAASQQAAQATAGTTPQQAAQTSTAEPEPPVEDGDDAGGGDGGGYGYGEDGGYEGGDTGDGADGADDAVGGEEVAAEQVTYAGYVDGDDATVAIAIQDGEAIAYVCDGAEIEAWLRGSAIAGQLDLTGKNGAELIGTFTDAAASGQVSAGGVTWTFIVDAVTEPSGLYRIAEDVVGARIDGGWIVLPDGRQVGLATVDGSTRPAPQLDTAAGTATIDGMTVDVELVEPAAAGS